jgi:hypothetical protein
VLGDLAVDDAEHVEQVVVYLFAGSWGSGYREAQDDEITSARMATAGP